MSLDAQIVDLMAMRDELVAKAARRTTAAPKPRKTAAKPKAKPKAPPKPRASRATGRPITGNQTGRPRHTRGTTLPTTAPSKNRVKTVAHHDAGGKHLPDTMVGGWKCKGCGWQGWREHPVVGSDGHPHPTMAMAGCTNCGAMHPVRRNVSHAQKDGAHDHPLYGKGLKKWGTFKSHDEDLDVAKDTDTGESALLRRDEPGGGRVTDLVGGRSNCPKSMERCGAEQAGKCSLCGVQVRDHEALGKTIRLLQQVAQDL